MTFKFSSSESERLNESVPGLAGRIEKQIEDKGIKANISEIIQQHRDILTIESDRPGNEGDEAMWANRELQKVQDRIS